LPDEGTGEGPGDVTAPFEGLDLDLQRQKAGDAPVLRLQREILRADLAGETQAVLGNLTDQEARQRHDPARAPAGAAVCIHARRRDVKPPPTLDEEGPAHRSSANASIAIVRARLIATVSSRWCRRQFPEIRRGTIRPRSVRKLRSSPTSLK